LTLVDLALRLATVNAQIAHRRPLVLAAPEARPDSAARAASQVRGERTCPGGVSHTIQPVHLHDVDAGDPQRTCQPGAVGAGAFNADGVTVPNDCNHDTRRRWPPAPVVYSSTPSSRRCRRAQR